MPRSRLGFNVATEHAGSNRQAVVDAQIALQSPFCLVLDDYKDGKWFFTKQIQARSPVTEVIHRRYWAVDPHNPKAGGWDGSLHRAPGITADNILNTLQGEQKRGGVKVIEQIYCEPSVHITTEDPQGNELKRMLKLIVDCIKGAAARGMRVAVDIGQPVTWKQAEFDAGFYDELIFTLAAYPENFLSIHEYQLGDLWYGCNAADMALLRFNSPRDAATLLAMPNDALKRYYVAKSAEAHLGRVEMFAQRCRKIGAPIPKMVYTEIGWDRTRIAEQETVNGINGREAMGYPTLAHYWHVRYPQWSQAQAACEQLKWLDRSMPDYVVGACIYGYDTSFEDGQYHIEDQALETLLIAYNAQQRATPTPTQPTPVPAPNPPPVEPLPQEPHAWQKFLTEAERSVYSRAKAGDLSLIESTMLKMGALLDEAYNGK